MAIFEETNKNTKVLVLFLLANVPHDAWYILKYFVRENVMSHL